MLTGEQYNAGMEQMKALPKEGLDQIIGMVKTMNARQPPRGRPR